MRYTIQDALKNHKISLFGGADILHWSVNSSQENSSSNSFLKDGRSFLEKFGRIYSTWLKAQYEMRLGAKSPVRDAIDC